MTQTTPAVGSEPRRSEPQRLHGLDALRAGALGLGIVLHSLLPFLPVDYWPVLDVHRTDAVSPVIDWIHLFRMVLFMLLAGYFGRMVLHRRGPRAYLRDRSLRILLPLIVFTPLLMAAYLGAFAVAASTGAPALDASSIGIPIGILLTIPAHLWFLAVLVQCVLVTLAVRALLVRLVGPDRLTAAARRCGGVLAGPAGVVVAAVPYAACLLMQGSADGGITEPATILPALPALTGYLGAFLVGWCLHARTDALARLARAWPVHLGAAVALMVVRYLELPLVAQAVVVGLAGWCWTFALVGLSVRFLRRESPTVRYLADASYWVYIAHLLVLGVVQALLSGLDWPIVVKLLVTWVVSGAVLLLSYDLLVRGTWVGRWLNGRRHRPLLRRTAEPARV